VHVRSTAASEAADGSAARTEPAMSQHECL